MTGKEELVKKRGTILATINSIVKAINTHSIDNYSSDEAYRVIYYGGFSMKGFEIRIRVAGGEVVYAKGFFNIGGTFKSLHGGSEFNYRANIEEADTLISELKDVLKVVRMYIKKCKDEK